MSNLHRSLANAQLCPRVPAVCRILKKHATIQTFYSVRYLKTSFRSPRTRLVSKVVDLLDMPQLPVDEESLTYIQAMNCMKHLDLSWNRLSNTRDDISVLRKHTPLLSTLDLQHNLWRKVRAAGSQAHDKRIAATNRGEQFGPVGKIIYHGVNLIGSRIEMPN